MGQLVWLILFPNQLAVFNIVPGDAPHALARMVSEGDVDVVTGDWLSEMNIAWNAITKAQHPALGYEGGFLEQLGECIDEIAAKSIKVVTNAGALNPRALSEKVSDLCESRALSHLVVATVVGGDVSHLLDADQYSKPALSFRHLDDESVTLELWATQLRPSCAVAYTGAWGIVAALAAGADIVVCGRVTDASPVIGAAAWWYGWSKTSYDQLAGALVAGHVIECGPYAVGGNFSGFKDRLADLVDIGFPIAEIAPDGTFHVTKPESMSGYVGKPNITAQLLYELQGEIYLNPDVAADLSKISVQDSSVENRVRVFGAVRKPPPASTKVMIAAPGGYQAEAIYYINGLDLDAKTQMMQAQLRHIFRNSNFSKFSVELYGREVVEPRSQQEGTAMLRIFVQARDEKDIVAEKFKKLVYALRMQSYPGYHMNLDFRLMDPRPFMEIFPSVIPQATLNHQVLIPKQKKVLNIPPPSETADYPTQRRSYETSDPVSLDGFGPTIEAPLGSIVHARSGDKANNCNVGFFVRSEDEYPWLQSLLTVQKLKQLLGDDYAGQKIERVEFQNLLAVHL